MSHKQYYENAKEKLFSDNSICNENKKWIITVLEYQETKGKRQNGLPALDESCYKTLLCYIQRLRNTIRWFKGKPIKDITEKEFRKIYEDLEEGRIKKANGKIYEDKSSYYNKIFKGKPFEILGLQTMARKVIEYDVKKDKEVRFISNFKQALKDLVQNAISPAHKLLIQLLGDYGENVFSILQIKKKDFERVTDKETKEVYYLINLHKGILKRSRTPRREYNLFPETRELLDKYLETLKADDNLFNFGLRQAEIMFDRAVKAANIKLQNGLKPVLKDLRSSMACHLLREGWTTDEIKGRLGHKPSSKVLDVYVSYLALNKEKVRKKIEQGTIEELRAEIDKLKEKSTKDTRKLEESDAKIKQMQEEFRNQIKELQAKIEQKFKK